MSVLICSYSHSLPSRVQTCYYFLFTARLVVKQQNCLVAVLPIYVDDCIPLKTNDYQIRPTTLQFLLEITKIPENRSYCDN